MACALVVLQVTPAWIEAFAVSQKYLPEKLFSATDLSEGGVATNVLGALPLFTSPMAMRPHYRDTWVELVIASNRRAAAECCAETGQPIACELADRSGDDVTSALQLLCAISGAPSRTEARTSR